MSLFYSYLIQKEKKKELLFPQTYSKTKILA